MTSRRITEMEIQVPNGIMTRVLYWTEDSVARSKSAASFCMEAEGKKRIARKRDRHHAADVFRSSDGFARLYDCGWLLHSTRENCKSAQDVLFPGTP
jgi:hypothetical protein